MKVIKIIISNIKNHSVNIIATIIIAVFDGNDSKKKLERVVLDFESHIVKLWLYVY